MFLNRYSFINRYLDVGVVTTYISNIVTILSSLYITVVIAKYGGSQVLGAFGIISAINGVIKNLASSRSGEAVVKFYCENIDGVEAQRAKVLLYVVIADFVSFLVVVSLVIAFSEFISAFWLDGAYKKELILLSIGTAIPLLYSSVLGYFQARKMFLHYNLISIISPGLQMMLITVVLAGGRTIDLEIIAWLTISTCSVSLFSSFVVYARSLYHDMGVRFGEYDPLLLRRFLVFNLQTFSSATLKAGNQRFDSLILGAFVPLADVGIYEFLRRLGSLVLFIAKPFTVVNYSRFAKAYGGSYDQDLWSFVIKISFYVFLFSILFSIAVALFSEFIFAFLELDFERPWLVVSLALITMAIANLFWWGRVYSSSKDPKISINVNFYSLIFQLVICSVLSWQFGLYGILIGMLLNKIYILWYFVNSAKGDFLWRPL